MVEIMAPQKGEVILDPACGTSGFLISSYKHIRNHNLDKKGNTTLTPDDRAKLAKNFKGYDIDPNMVRLSLANMYLHGFTEPHIFEYDSLTSEERWNEFADVILANPPFMSPKGGIKPHKRFSIQAKRSEVLFVDYIAEHLTPKGRAAIIVPEGIIFQSQTAYKELRKMLVDNSLVAVISLPAGCFNPYSGVKTSILILDKSIAKTAKTVAFFKIENDGFGLGAQRRAIEQNDLPQVKSELAVYLQALRTKASTDSILPVSSTAQIISKEKIAENGDYNLSGERYREGVITTSSYPFVLLSEVANVKNGYAFKSEEYIDKGLRVIRIKNVQNGEVIDDDPKFIALERRKEFNDYTLKTGDILMSLTGNVGRVGRLKHEHEPAVLNQRVAHVELTNEDNCLSGYLFALLNTKKFENDAIEGSGGVAQANLSSKWVSEYKIPLPPLEVQKEIVAEIEGYQKVIDGARAVIDNYRPHIPINPDWPMVELGEITKPEYGYTEKALEKGDARFIRITDISQDGKLRTEDPKFISLTEDAKGSLLSNGDILVARTGATFGKTMIFEEKYPAVFASFLIRLKFDKNQILSRYYWIFSQSELYWKQANSLMTGGGQPQFNGNALVQVKIPLPPLAIQEIIVAEIQAEQALVSANRELISRFEKKIQDTLSRIWGESV
jgi:type I restriction enzyme M protein